jgi:putative spermidine/putrescine transport system ATP-binding protein/spermidine/putrescine transport system ATP-binding protein
MANIIEIRNLVKTFRGGVVAVNDVSVSVRNGEFLTILGPSGCGKTTTLRMIGGFEFPDSGHVILDGQDVTELPAFRRPVNMMFQDFALFPHMTVAENIAYGPWMGGAKKKEIKSQVEDALRTIELLDKADNKPFELSIGQRQRVALARALIRQPKVLLLDEPMSALDARLREAMQVELKRLHEKLGLTFIMVTHDQTEALVMSDRIMVMEVGRVVQIGSPTELYEHPATPYVATFLGNSNMLTGEVREVGADDVTVSCGHILLRCAGRHDSMRPGDPVTLSLRPEKVSMLISGATAPSHFNRMKGRVLEQFFHGDAIRLTIDAGVDRNIAVHRQLEADIEKTPLPSIGNEVEIAVDPENISLFPGLVERLETVA